MCVSFCVFFFSSRRRHTRCALVTGVQTCALPIFEESIAAGERDRRLQENRYLLDAVPAAEIGSRAGPVHAASLKVWNAIAERSGVPYVDATLIASIPPDLLNDDLFYWVEIKPLDPDRHQSEESRTGKECAQQLKTRR